MKKSKLIVVLGMHRSGTSATTRGLEVMGVNLGDYLYPAAIDNPTGFWEDTDFLEINEELLAQLGSASDRLGLINWKVPNTSPYRSLRRKAERLVRTKSDENVLWGFKDPRTARLLPFWQSVFERVNCEVHYLVVTRNPLSIAESLNRRNDVEAEKSYYLWLEHVIPAVLETKGAKRLVVDFDRLIEDPGPELSRVARTFELPEPEPLALTAYESEFLELELRHTCFTRDDLDVCPSIPAQVIAAYDWLLKLANDEAVLDSYEVEQAFEALALELGSLSPALSYMDRLEQKAVALSRIAAQREESTTALLAQLEELQSGNAWLTSQVDAWEQSATQCEKAVAALTSQLQEAEERVALQESKLNKIRSHWVVRLAKSLYYNELS